MTAMPPDGPIPHTRYSVVHGRIVPMPDPPAHH